MTILVGAVPDAVALQVLLLVAGPRDGLWVGLADRTRLPVWLIRTAIEFTVLVTGFLLGGTVGVGTVVFALTIGPLVQLFLPWFTWGRAGGPGRDTPGPG